MTDKKLDLNNVKLEYGRYNFSKIRPTELPNLSAIQTESYRKFREQGIKDVFNDFFPIRSIDGKFKNEITDDQLVELEFVDCKWAEPKNSVSVCKEKGYTYSSSLSATLRLKKPDGTINEGDIYMGDYPLMTPSGTFIINGAERVIVSQIVRSPGAYIAKVLQDRSGEYTYEADIIPARGTWLEFITDSKNGLMCRIDKQKKVPSLTMLRAIGLTKESDLRDMFGFDIKALEDTIEKYPPQQTSNSKNEHETIQRKAIADIFNKLRPGEPSNPESQLSNLKQRFFDHRHYDLGPAGRFKIAKKLGIYNRLANHILAEDLIDSDGEIVYEQGTLLTKEIVDELRKNRFFEQGAMTFTFTCNEDLDHYNQVNMVKVYLDEEKSKVINIIGTDLNIDVSVITQSDIVSLFSYFLNVIEGLGDVDDIDHLGNRRVKCVGELIQNYFRQGLSRMEKQVKDKMTSSDVVNLSVSSIMNMKPLNSLVRDFFNSSQLSQIMDQTNPLAELTNKRRISALGPGGIQRDRASMEVRDVHYSHYGRICPIETPEGQNIGLISNLACYAEVNEHGFIQTPYRKIDPITHQITDEVYKLTADDERNHKIAPSSVEVDPVTRKIIGEKVVCRFNGQNILVNPEEVDFIDVSPKQIVSIATACIPFLENDDIHRAMMGANMQRQALSLIRPHAPYVGTGLERIIAKDSGSAVVAEADGVIKYVDSCEIVVSQSNNEEKTYVLRKFERANQGTCINQYPIVKVGDKVTKGQIIADGPAMDHGELALGQNVLIAFMNWHGYNYEDAVIMSERLVKDDVYTSIHIEEYSIDRRKTKLGDEVFTRDVPNISESDKTFLDARGIIVKGAEVKEGDILVGKTTPRGVTQQTSVDKLLAAIFNEKNKEGKDASLRIPHGGAGIVLDVKTFSRANKDELAAGILETVKVYVVQKRKISEGDKMSGRHGNKGVISRILPVEDMPFLPNGRPVDIMLSPLGVPSRMNIGQILEVHLGLACEKLGIKIATPVFDGVTNAELSKIMDMANMSKDGKTVLYDGITGERYDNRINVGIMYMIKLVHMVDDKLHARSIGPYSLVTQQPLGGKAQNGGQRFGEMEVWALEAYGAAHTLQEMLTIKSDDMVGRNKAYEAILRGHDIPKPNMPESFRVLIKELQGLAINVTLKTKDGKTINVNTITAETAKEQSKVHQNINKMGSSEEERLKNERRMNPTVESED